MHSIASLGPHTQTDPGSTRSVDSLRVAFVQSTAEALARRPVRQAVSPAADPAPANSTLEHCRDVLTRERVASTVIGSVEHLRRDLTPETVWLVAVDADDVSAEELIRLLELQNVALTRGSAVYLIAWCSPSTSPAKLWRLFQSGAYLCERNVTPDVLLRACQLAARGRRAPLLRFSERAGFSGAECRAFLAECAGLSKCEAADELGCSQRTLETYWSRIFAKLRIRSTDGVVAAALRFAMLDPGAALA